MKEKQQLGHFGKYEEYGTRISLCNNMDYTLVHDIVSILNDLMNQIYGDW